MIVTNITKGNNILPCTEDMAEILPKDATHETMVQEFAKKNGTSGTCGEMTPLLFLYHPKYKMNSTTLILTFFYPKSI